MISSLYSVHPDGLAGREERKIVGRPGGMERGEDEEGEPGMSDPNLRRGRRTDQHGRETRAKREREERERRERKERRSEHLTK